MTRTKRRFVAMVLIALLVALVAQPGQYYDFRLWDPIHRGKPLAERVVP